MKTTREHELEVGEHTNGNASSGHDSSQGEGEAHAEDDPGNTVLSRHSVCRDWKKVGETMCGRVLAPQISPDAFRNRVKSRGVQPGSEQQGSLAGSHKTRGGQSKDYSPFSPKTPNGLNFCINFMIRSGFSKLLIENLRPCLGSTAEFCH